MIALPVLTEKIIFTTKNTTPALAGGAREEKNQKTSTKFPFVVEFFPSKSG
jgi:hypothetical protein